MFCGLSRLCPITLGTPQVNCEVGKACSNSEKSGFVLFCLFVCVLLGDFCALFCLFLFCFVASGESVGAVTKGHEVTASLFQEEGGKRICIIGALLETWS